VVLPSVAAEVVVVVSPVEDEVEDDDDDDDDEDATALVDEEVEDDDAVRSASPVGAQAATSPARHACDTQGLDESATQAGYPGGPA
jgi:hypothetical protein